MKTAKVIVFTLGLTLTCGVTLAKDESTAHVKETLSKVTTAEVPAKAAELVSQAKADDREVFAAEVVKTAVKGKPAVTLAVVGAVCHKSPETAPTVAATAASIQPSQAKQIAQAAAAAAPAKAAEIVKAIAKVLPKTHREVGLAVAQVAQVAPQSSKEILASIPAPTTAEPKTPDAANNYRAPTIGGPFVPLSTTPGNVPPGGGVVPEGGRDYASP